MNCIIIHGTNERDLERIKEQKLLPQNERHWIPWLKDELEKKGIKTFTPLMPRNWNPSYEDWKDYFEQFLVDEKSILIGHSAGGGFLVRWLGETKTKIKKLILVTPVIISSNEWPNLHDLLKFEINEKIAANIKEIVIFSSDNDPTWAKSVETFSKTLNVKPIVLKSQGHFIEKHMGTTKFPELIKEIVKK